MIPDARQRLRDFSCETGSANYQRLIREIESWKDEVARLMDRVDVLKAQLRSAAQASRPAPPLDWQPIATAPKGVTVLLWWEYWHRYPCIGRYVRGRWESEIAVSTEGPEPTHWMPLPDPPAAVPQASPQE